MRPKNIKHCIIAALLIVSIIGSSSIYAQQTRAYSSQPTQQQSDQSLENKQAMGEIEQMRQMIRERREQQEQQRQVLQELQEAIASQTGGNSTKSNTQYQKPTTTTYTTTNAPARQQAIVTSGSILSKIEFQEREELRELEKKYDFDMRTAQREIDLLKKQLNIANTQLDKCESSTPIHVNEYAQQTYMEPSYQPVTYQAEGNHASIYGAPTQQQNTTTTTAAPQQSKISEKDRKALDEIEMMRSMLKERREQQAEQMRVLKELQQQIP